MDQSLSVFLEAVEHLERPSELDAAGPATLSIVAAVPLVYSLTRLRDTAAGLAGRRGEAIAAGATVRAVISIEGEFTRRVSRGADGRVRVTVSRNPEAARPVTARVASSEVAEAPPVGPDESPLPGAEDDVGPLAAVVTSETAAAVAAERLAAQLCRAAQQADAHAPLLDGSFAAVEAGRALLRRALAGDYTWLDQTVRGTYELHPCALGGLLRRHLELEVLVQPERRRRKPARHTEPPRLAADAAGCGRLFAIVDDQAPPGYAYNTAQSLAALAAGCPSLQAAEAGASTLAFFDRRRLLRREAAVFLEPVAAECGLAALPAHILAGAGEDTLGVETTLEIDARAAGAWWDAPGESGPLFFETHSRVSVAVQRALRAWLPYLCLAGHPRLEAPEIALPMLVYAVSRPFHGRPKHDFTYDVLSEPSMAAVFRHAGRPLAARLADVRMLLSAAGRREAARQFDPDEVKKCLDYVRARPRNLHALLSAEAALVGALVRAGCECARSREAAAAGRHDTRGLMHTAEQMAKTFNDRLRRLYAGKELLSLGGLVLVEATHALNQALERRSEIRAVLKIAGEAAPRGGRIVSGSRAFQPANTPAHSVGP